MFSLSLLVALIVIASLHPRDVGLLRVAGAGGRRVFDAIEVKRRGVVRRAKLYYLRDRRGKSARIAEKQTIRPVKGVVVPETGAAQKADETEA